MGDSPKKSPGNNYTVGKGRPPLATRWRPGQSGNPKGRPKYSKSIYTLIAEQLDQKVTVNEGGKSRKMTLREAIVKTQITRAIKGDPKALDYILAIESEIPKQIERSNYTIPKDVPAEQAMKIYQEFIKKPF